MMHYAYIMRHAVYWADYATMMLYDAIRAAFLISALLFFIFAPLRHYAITL